ncbi:MAG: hypothetical protein AB7O56_10990 [Bauldia sp.]
MKSSLSLAWMRLACALAFAAIVALPAPASTQEAPAGTFGVFTTDPDQRGTLILDDTLHFGSAGNFLWAIDTIGPPERLLLNSGGGSVEDALFIADAVRSLQIETEVPEGAICYSACVAIFLAGVGRTAIGELGVHEYVQAFGDTRIPNPAFTATAQDAFRRFGASQELIDLAWGTVYPTIHVLTPEEIEAFGVNRTREDGLRLIAEEGYATPPATPDEDLIPWQPIGEPAPGVDYIVRRAGMPDETYFGYVQWYATPSQGVVVAEVVVPDLGIGYRFLFGPFSDNDEPYFYGGVYVTKLSTAGQVPIERIWEFGLAYDFGAPELGPGPHIMQIGQAARPVAYDTTGLLFPRILRESYVERFAKTEVVYLAVSLDGTLTNTASLYFLINETGHEAFAEALVKWDGIF